MLKRALAAAVVCSLLAPALAQAQQGPDAPPAGEQPAAEQPAAEQPAAEQPAAEPPATPADEAARAVDSAIDEATRPAGPIGPPPPAQQMVNIVALGNLKGRFAEVSCRRDDVLRPEDMHYAKQAAYWQTLAALSQDIPGAGPIALNVGDSAFPGRLGRYLLSADAEGGQRLAELLHQIPYEAHALGNNELGMARPELERFVAGAQAVGLPLQAANLRCNATGGAEAICEAVGTGPDERLWSVVERGDLRIGVVSVLDPATADAIAPSRAVGLDLLDPVEMLGPIVARMRQEDAVDLVVVQYHAVAGQRQAGAQALASGVDGIDLLVTNQPLGAGPAGVGDRATAGYIVAPSTGTVVVGADTGPGHVVAVDATATATPGSDDGRDWRLGSIQARAVDVSDVAPQPTTAALLNTIASEFCSDWGQPINAQAPLTKPFETGDFRTFALNVMRFATESEVALVNAGAFADEQGFPLPEHLTMGDVYSVLPYNNQLVEVEVPGSLLAGLADKLDGELVAVGLDKRGDTLLVNGRPINPERSYEVATNLYLADGGDDLLPQDKISEREVYHPAWSTDAPSIGELVVHYVGQGDILGQGAPGRLDPTANFPDLHRRLLWHYTGSLDLSFNQVKVDTPQVGGEAAYEQSQLTVDDTTQINLEGRGSINADSRNHGWDNSLQLQYAQARLAEADEFEETKDLIRFISVYKYTGWRADLGGEWYVPIPFIEAQVESEFNRPEERDWHRVELTGIAGSKFRLFEPLEVKLGGNVRRDLNKPEADTTYGVNAGYTLKRISLIDLLDKPVHFESDLEFFYNDIGAQDIQELRNSYRLYYSVYEQLFFTTTFSAFAYRTAAVGQWGTNTELMAGLNYFWSATEQSF